MKTISEQQFLQRTLQPIPPLRLEKLPGNAFLKGVLGGLLLEKELDEIFMLPRQRTFCLTGEAGTGKRTLVEAFAGSAAVKGYLFYRVTHALFHMIPEESRTVFFEKLIEEAAEAPCILLFEPQGDSEYWEELNYIWAALSRAAQIIVFIVECDRQAVKAGNLRNLQVFSLELPGHSERRAFFEAPENKMPRRSVIPGSQEKEPSFQRLAELSEGLSYREMQQVVTILRLQLKERALSQYGGDLNQVVQALRAQELVYTEGQFEAAVKAVEKSRLPSAPQAGIPAMTVPGGGDTAGVPGLIPGAGHDGLGGIYTPPQPPDSWAQTYGVDAVPSDQELWDDILRKKS
ncbi:MAG: ATP-binding protein [Eubacterium sp.]|nr:ATP-binding protein [Eubacterium sp.]